MRWLALCIALFAAPASADVLSALTACQAERQDIAGLSAALRLQGWQGVPPTLDFDRATRLNMLSLTNIPASGALQPASPVADWQIVWTDATNWANTQILRFVAGSPQYASLLEDASGNMLYVQIGETADSISIACTMAVNATAAADPAFLPELTPNIGEGSVASVGNRIDNRFSRATHIIIELAIRPQDFIDAIGVPTDVVAVLYTSATYPKESQ